MRKHYQEKDALSKKIEKMYQNYGLDTSNMTDDEFERMKSQYINNGKNIDVDLKESEKFKERFANDIV
jgi:hypothetical protein